MPSELCPSPYSPLPQAWAVVTAGGEGKRFAGNKLLASLGGVPVLVRTVQTLLQAETINGVMIVAEARKVERYQHLFAEMTFSKPIHWAIGGPTRQASVFNGLTALERLKEAGILESVPIVAIHDAARPLVDPDRINTAVYRVASGCAGAVLGLPLANTLKRIVPASSPETGQVAITCTEDRSQFWVAHTPQVFIMRYILEAHRYAIRQQLLATDDSQLFEGLYPGQAQCILDSPHNLKITTPDDLILAEAILHRLQPQV